MLLAPYAALLAAHCPRLCGCYHSADRHPHLPAFTRLFGRATRRLALCLLLALPRLDSGHGVGSGRELVDSRCGACGIFANAASWSPRRKEVIACRARTECGVAVKVICPKITNDPVLLALNALNAARSAIADMRAEHEQLTCLVCHRSICLSLAPSPATPCHYMPVRGGCYRPVSVVLNLPIHSYGETP